MKAQTDALANLQDFPLFGKKIIGVELNYKSAAKEKCVIAPKEPIFFIKPVTAYVLEPRDIRFPKKKSRIMHGVCLGVVIGRKCRCVCAEGARAYVGGYCIALDLMSCSITDPFNRGMPWVMGRGFDTSCPVSRFIHASRVDNPQSLELWCTVNGRMRQMCNTHDMIFTVEELIAKASSAMTLEPSDMILTGTPSGASLLHTGDIVEFGLGGLVQSKFKVHVND